jgi:hypothetical protein
MKEVQELTHARMEPAIAGFPGLFAARTAGVDVLDAQYQLGDVELRMLAAHRPRPADLMLLCVLVSLAGPAGRAPAEALGDFALVCALECAPPATGAGTIVLKTTRARVLSECGVRDGGSTRKVLRESLIRLTGLTAIVRRGQQEVSMHLLSFTIDEATGELVVALSPRLSAAVLGGRHVRLQLGEMRKLSEHGRVLYTRLCAWIDPGSTRRVGLDVLEGYLWTNAPTSAVAVRDRRRLVRRAMSALGRLPGWRVEADARGRQYTISRPPVISLTEAVISPTEAVKTLTLKSVISP